VRAGPAPVLVAPRPLRVAASGGDPGGSADVDACVASLASRGPCDARLGLRTVANAGAGWKLDLLRHCAALGAAGSCVSLLSGARGGEEAGDALAALQARAGPESPIFRFRFRFLFRL